MKKSFFEKLFAVIFVIATPIIISAIWVGKLLGENIVIGLMIAWALLCIILFLFFNPYRNKEDQEELYQ